MFPGNLTPVYVQGKGYVLSQKMAARLFEASFDEPFITIEDMYVTGILAKKIGVRPLTSHLFVIHAHYTVCTCRGLMLMERGHSDRQTLAAIMQFIFTEKVVCPVM